MRIKIQEGASRLLTRQIARLNRRKTHGKAAWLAREACLRVRALLLLRGYQEEAWSLSGIIRSLILLLDPVAAGLWPRLRRRRGLTPPQRVARWLSSLGNSEAREAFSSGDLLRIRQGLQTALDEQRCRNLLSSSERDCPRAENEAMLGPCQSRTRTKRQSATSKALPTPSRSTARTWLKTIPNRRQHPYISYDI